MITLIRHGRLYAPEDLGTQDILVLGERIARMADHLEPVFPDGVPVQEVDAAGRLVFPGFVDGHVHIAGGGGEGGFRTRTPEVRLADLVQAGVTTVIGCLGTDSVTRSPEALYAKARALEEEGLSAYLLTGAYRVPVPTFTGDPMKDLILIDRVVGAGEVAISDHRSAQPRLEELQRLAADVRVGGILSGKAGVLNLHVGDGPDGLKLLRALVAGGELPYRQFLPTHVNRNERLFQEAVAYALDGGFIDITCSEANRTVNREVPAPRALKRCLEAGVPASRITFTSDGQGSLPLFNERRECVGMGIGRVTALFGAVRKAVLEEQVDLEAALATITRNPAEVYKLKGKGRIAEGWDADLVLVDPEGFTVETVLARGRILMRQGRMQVAETFQDRP